MAQQIIPDDYYRRLLEQAPAGESCGFAHFNPETMIWTATLWDREISIFAKDRRVEDPGQPVLHEFFHLFLVYMILHPTLVEPEGEWISEKDFPGGPTFFRGPHLLPTDQITARFGNNLDQFEDHCRKLGGSRLNMGDAGYRFSILPKLDVAVVYWCGDEDFPAEARILYDLSLKTVMPLDMIFALACGVCDRLGHCD